MTTPPVPLSPEVLAHHVALHPCDADVGSITCPCGDAWAGVCVACGVALFVAVRPATPWCEHARAVLEAFG